MSNTTHVNHGQVTAFLEESPRMLKRLNIQSEVNLRTVNLVVPRLAQSDFVGDSLRPLRDCVACGLRKKGSIPYAMVPTGPVDSHYVFFGRSPTRSDTDNSEVFHSKSAGGILFDSYCRSLGLDRTEAVLTNSVLCMTPDERPPSLIEVKVCSTRASILWALLTSPKFVFLLGNDASRSVIDPDLKSISPTYGISYFYRHHVHGNVFLFPIYHMGSVLRKRDLGVTVNLQLDSIAQKFIGPFKQFLTENPNLEQIREWQPITK